MIDHKLLTEIRQFINSLDHTVRKVRLIHIKMIDASPEEMNDLKNILGPFAEKFGYNFVITPDKVEFCDIHKLITELSSLSESAEGRTKNWHKKLQSLEHKVDGVMEFMAKHFDADELESLKEVDTNGEEGSGI